MRKPWATVGLVALGAVLGGGLVHAGRLLERGEALERAPVPAASATDVEREREREEHAPSVAAPRRSVAPAVTPALRRYDEPAEVIERAKSAYERALRSALAQPAYDADELVLLRLVAVGAGDGQLARRFSTEHLKDKGDPFARLLDPSAPAPRLSARLERGIARLHQYLLASVGEPEDVALELLASFAARQEQGYALCHQALALGWFEASGRRLTDELLTRRGELLDRIASEQEADSRASDLFAERASTLLLYGAPPRDEVRRWVAVLSAAQSADGAWPAERRTLEFDGETVHVEQDAMHTVAHALFVLRRFLDTSAAKP